LEQRLDALEKENARKSDKISDLQKEIDLLETLKEGIPMDIYQKTIDDLKRKERDQSILLSEKLDLKRRLDSLENESSLNLTKISDLEKKIEELETITIDVPTLKSRGWRKGKSWKFDVFVSYSHLDADKAITLAKSFEDAGLIVWYDKKRLRTGEGVSKYIELALEDALRAIVLWSTNASRSPWVLSEAEFAHKHKKLMPVIIEKAKLPIFCTDMHFTDLSNWDGSTDFPPYLKLIEDIKMYISIAKP
jgi:hypothetical protein